MDNPTTKRSKKSDKAKTTRQKNGPYSTRSARITTSVQEQAVDSSKTLVKKSK